MASLGRVDCPVIRDPQDRQEKKARRAFAQNIVPWMGASFSRMGQDEDDFCNDEMNAQVDNSRIDEY
jgi:hypothetical protein